MPTTEEYTLEVGADLTLTLGAHGAQIEQALKLATPNSYRGLVIYSETTPATTGQPTGYPTNWYQWHRRCLWLKPSTGEVFRWDGTTWSLAKGSVAALAITNGMIANGTIQIGKLSPTGGTALQIIRVNAGGTALEYATLASSLANNSVALAKLVGGGAGVYVLTSTNGTNTWELFDSAAVIGLFSSNQFPIDYLAHGSALQVPMMNAGGSAITWASVLTGIPNYTIPLSKLSKVVADAGKYLRVQADGSVLAETLTVPPSSTNFASSNEVIAGTEAAKAIAPDKARYIPGAKRAFALVKLTVNEGGTDDITGVALVSGSIGVASVTFIGATSFRVTFSETLFTDLRRVLLYPRNSGATSEAQYIVPAALTFVPSTNTFSAAYDTDSSLVVSVSGLTVPASGDYHIAIEVI